MEINVDEVDSADDASSDDRDKTTHRDDACAKLSSSASIVIRTNKPNATTATYHCIYCNHSFKSHYCYQVRITILRWLYTMLDAYRIREQFF